MEIDKTIKQLKSIFILSVILTSILFVFDVLYVTKYIQATENVGLERWGIILTLAGIFASLKFLHPTIKESDEKNTAILLKKYSKRYYLRLVSLLAVFSFNIICLHITGIKNFMFLAFITIFAIFLCAPSRKHIESEIENDTI
ncbi:MAG: hypothetical protein E6772_14470 [Dysgonomonas sp.]|nr:hypothetical protein [Dysgonomonas sp.]